MVVQPTPPNSVANQARRSIVGDSLRKAAEFYWNIVMPLVSMVVIGRETGIPLTEVQALVWSLRDVSAHLGMRVATKLGARDA